MTISEAIVKVLDEQKSTLTYLEVYDQIIAKKYYEFKKAKTPTDTIGSRLGDFIRKNDTRVKRIKGERGFEYYLSKYEDQLNLEEIIQENSAKGSVKSKRYNERDLHKLLSSYLKNKHIFSKTIFHEKSLNSKDHHQKWIHPDMVGIRLHKLKNKSSQALMKLINKEDLFELSSYEIKKEVKSDYDLKKFYFQTVSNSSWANYGYLVAFEISSNLMDEIERLNQSFGIGVIELKSNPYESNILFPAKAKELDYKTIDKLCIINEEYEKFIEQTETLLTASEKYIKGAKNEFEKFCDDVLVTDSEIEKYCKLKNIPKEKTV